MNSISTSEIEESPGVISMMRKAVKATIRAGAFLIISAFALSIGMLIVKQYELVPVAVAMVTAGPTMMSVALGAKAWQAQAEGRYTQSVTIPGVTSQVQNVGR